MVKEEHRSLEPTIQEIVERVVAPLSQVIDEEDRFPREAFVAMGLADLLGLVVPPPYGSGLDYPCLVTVVEAIAATSPSTAWAYVMHVSSSAGIALTGVEELRQRLLPALVKGEGLATFAFS
ncbi:MAG: acyl-CoA dehydrogenase family protein, partial [Chloroflexi bacterium]|nr:acyl-CoA dehydrogenase family protein [Chloroflexota bacterium]